MSTVSLQTHIDNLKSRVEKFEYIAQHFPDIKYHPIFGLSSKSVNNNFDNWDFEFSYQGLYVLPYKTFEFNNEKIKIYSSPRRNRLAYRFYSHLDKKYYLRFSRYVKNFTKNSFNNEIVKSCHTAVLNYISSRKMELDQRHLDPDVKKLLLFI